MPVSVTVTIASVSSWPTWTVIAPSKVYFNALDRRLSITFSHISRSRSTGSVERRTVHGEGQPGPVDRGAEDTGQFGGEAWQVGRLEVGLHATCLDPREVEQRVDQLGQSQPVALNELQFLSRVLVEIGRLVQQLVDRPEDQGERSAELVADVGEERGLGPVEFGQLLGPLLLALVAPRTTYTRGDVPGYQLDEAAVGVVESAMPVQRCHQEPLRHATLLQKRHDERLCGRLAPGAGRQIQ